VLRDPSTARRARRRRHEANPPRPGDRAAGTRVEILRSAAVAFRKLGYHGATVEQIAASLHMKKGNLYYYFKDKEEILFACHQHSLGRLLGVLEDIEHAPLAPDERLKRLIESAVHIILDELGGTALFLDLEALRPAHLRSLVVGRDRFDHGVRKIIAQGIASGIFQPRDAKLTGFAILGAVNWIPRWFDPAGPSSSDHIATIFADYLIAGLRR
jgi:TetR/AcrR family transcriptional regulator, cholesterol catabolism regulator